MSIFIDIEKKFKEFSLCVKLESSSSSLGILGASGSGKSMTLRCIAGIETPDRGRIVINGRTVFDSEHGINEKPQKRKIGYLFQNYALFPAMTVGENISCGFRGNKQETKQKVQEYMKRYHLEGLEDRYPSQLSGGQQQRTALARMMMAEPEMILLDEPFSALDSYLKDILQRDMKEFLKDYKGDMLIVTHSREEAFQFCEELTLLENGQILNCGETRHIFEEPGSLEGARLTGCKNISRIERKDSHHIYAADWDLLLYTEKEVQADHTHVAVRGHWLVSGEELTSIQKEQENFRKENLVQMEWREREETPFEDQYLIKKEGALKAEKLWWMKPKRGIGTGMVSTPLSIYFPPEKLMLLKG